jgi:hypothetical protein
VSVAQLETVVTNNRLETIQLQEENRALRAENQQVFCCKVVTCSVDGSIIPLCYSCASHESWILLDPISCRSCSSSLIDWCLESYLPKLHPVYTRSRLHRHCIDIAGLYVNMEAVGETDPVPLPGSDWHLCKQSLTTMITTVATLRDKLGC